MDACGERENASEWRKGTDTDTDTGTDTSTGSNTDTDDTHGLLLISAATEYDTRNTVLFFVLLYSMCRAHAPCLVGA